MPQYVAYYRVSTARQGRSGLGLEAQRAAVRAFPLAGEIVAEFTEQESGKRDDRPVLAQAIAEARARKATLLIAKLDRLARNVEFVARLMNSGVEFVACDVPAANKLTIHILAAVAEAEREAISARTKSALAAAKARGTRLGGRREGQHRLSAADRQASAKRRAANATARAASVLPIIKRIKADGITSAAGIAKALNERGIPTPRGGNRWQAVQVQRVFAKAG